MITTLPQPTDIRGIDPVVMAQPRRVIAYRTKHGRDLVHIATVEPFVVICPKHRGRDLRVKVDGTATGARLIDALTSMSDQMFAQKVDPVWLCPDCAGQIRWWLGGAS